MSGFDLEQGYDRAGNPSKPNEFEPMHQPEGGEISGATRCPFSRTLMPVVPTGVDGPEPVDLQQGFVSVASPDAPGFIPAASPAQAVHPWKPKGRM